MSKVGMVEGKVVIVTGAGGGIGREVALLMARNGARVVVNDVGASLSGEIQEQGAAGKVVAEIVAAGGEALASTDSVASWDGAHRIVETALKGFGRVDCVVNNAGILRDRMFHKMSEDDWRAVIDVHLHGSFFVSRAAAAHFREQQSGAFVHMTSNAGLIGTVGQANYSAAKMAIVGLSRSIAIEMSRYGVRSNCISPTAWSRMIGSVPSASPEQAAWLDKMKQMTPDKIAPLAVYLASDAAKEVTGQIFGVRRNEILLYGQTRPVRTIHMSDGWTPGAIAAQAMPAFRKHFTPLDHAGTFFDWDPI